MVLRAAAPFTAKREIPFAALGGIASPWYFDLNNPVATPAPPLNRLSCRILSPGNASRDVINLFIGRNKREEAIVGVDPRAARSAARPYRCARVNVAVLALTFRERKEAQDGVKAALKILLILTGVCASANWTITDSTTPCEQRMGRAFREPYNNARIVTCSKM